MVRNRGQSNMRRMCLTKILLIIMIIFISVAIVYADTKKPIELTLVWHSGGLGDLLAEMSKEYTKQTGVLINVELVPWAQWHDKIAAEFATHESGFDLVVFDSQSMSEFASQDHVVLLNPHLETSTKIKTTDYDPVSLRQYAEYPEGSKNFYALPINQDAMGLAYRKDLFEDPKDMAAFKAKYGYDIAIPQTYDQLRDIAEFFTRPDQNLYGIAMYGSRDYDAVTSAFNNVLWSFGGELWDPKTGKAEGVINSPASVAALEYYKKLFHYAPPGATKWYYDEVNNAVNKGMVAMAINWYYFFSAYSNAKINEFAGKMGFAPLPGKKGSDGKFRQYNSVGGQGISISKHSKNIDEAWKFLEWFTSDENQWKWVRGGGQTGRLDILSSPEYAEATPYNTIFPISMSRVKDYWHLVEYPKLLEIYQKYVNLAITNSMPPKEALDNVAKEHQVILNSLK